MAFFFMSFHGCAHNFKAFPKFIFVTGGFKLAQREPSRGNCGLKTWWKLMERPQHSPHPIPGQGLEGVWREPGSGETCSPAHVSFLDLSHPTASRAHCHLPTVPQGMGWIKKETVFQSTIFTILDSWRALKSRGLDLRSGAGKYGEGFFCFPPSPWTHTPKPP